MAVKADGSNFEERECGNCVNATAAGGCALRISEASRAHTVAGVGMYEFFCEFKDPCVELSAWRKRPC